MVGRDGARSEKPRRSRASLPAHPSRVMRIGGACCVRGTAPGAIPLAVWCPEGAWGGFASLIVVDWPCSSHEQGLCCRDEASAAASADGERDGTMTDLPLIKAA